jgi:hypothetical protein
MANGSFGLSGLPTAPTTVGGGSSIVNPFTQTEVTLASVNGFSSGDLVYQYNGDYQVISSTAASSSTFPVTTQTVTNIGSGLGGFQQIQSNRFNNTTKTVATLSNGNIVWVFNKYTASGIFPYFKITDENNTEVVAETVIESVAMPNQSIGPTVSALSGGGFVVAWVNSSGYIRYAVYSNTGTVTTALQNDTGVTAYSGNYQFAVASRPVSGGFVFTLMENSSLIVKHRVYGATGTATYAWTSNNTLPSVYGWPRVAVRSDDSFVVISMNASASTYIYYLWDSTNNAVTNGSFSASPSSAFGQDVCALSNDVFILVAGTNTGLFYRTLTGSTLSGSSVRISPGTSSSSSEYVAVRPLTNGGWAVVYTTATIDDSQQFYQGLVYVNVYNSANTLLSVTYKGSTTSYTGFPYNFIPGSLSSNTYFGLTETTNYIHVVTNGYNASSKTQQWARFNKTTYSPVPFTSTTVSAVNTPALATGAYAPAGSTPTAAAFYAASTSTAGWETPSLTESIILAASTTIDTAISTITYTDSASLSTGGAVIAYSGYAPGSVGYTRFAVYNGVGNQILPVTALNSDAGAVKVIGLTSNKFAMWSNNVLYVYSNTGAQLTSLTTNFTVDGSHSISLAPLPNGRFVVFANASSSESYYLKFTVYNDSLNVLYGPYTVDAYNTLPCQVATLGDNIYVIYRPSGQSGNVNQMTEFLPTGTNTWSLYANNSITSGYPINSRAFGLNSGTFIRIYTNNSGSGTIQQMNSTGSAFATNSFSVYNNGTNVDQSPLQIAPTCNGNYFYLATPNSGSNSYLNFYYGFTGVAGNSASGIITSNYQTAGAKPTVAGLSGEKMLIGYVPYVTSTGREYMTVAIVDAGRYQGTQSIVAGSSISNASTVLSPSTGFRLVGVATSTAPAGGTGTVVINGNATLSSSYSSVASPGQAFDFSGPVAFGAAGTVIGRNVNLQGNV